MSLISLHTGCFGSVVEYEKNLPLNDSNHDPIFGIDTL